HRRPRLRTAVRAAGESTGQEGGRAETPGQEGSREADRSPPLSGNPAARTRSAVTPVIVSPGRGPRRRTGVTGNRESAEPAAGAGAGRRGPSTSRTLRGPAPGAVARSRPATGRPAWPAGGARAGS